MKKSLLLLALAGIYCIVSGQYSFIQDFKNGTQPETGWVIHVGGTYNSEPNSGKAIPSLMFSANNQYIETPSFKGQHSLSFWMKGNKTDSASTMQVLIFCNNNWYLAHKISQISQTGANYSFMLPDTAEKLKFEYKKSAGNVALDDIVLFAKNLFPEITYIRLTENNDVAALINIKTNNIGKITYLVTSKDEPSPNAAQIADTSLYSGKILDYGKTDITKPDSTSIVLQCLPSNSNLKAFFIVADLKDSFSIEQQPVKLGINTPERNRYPFFKGIYKGDASAEKAIQIFNPTKETINLTNYRILVATNGKGWGFDYYFENGKSIKPGSTYLIVNAGAEFIDIDKADEITTSVLCKFSGNDALALQKKFDNSNAWYIIDIFGNPYSSANFNIAGKKSAANKYNAIRKDSVDTGNVNWSVSAGNTEGDSEWELIALSDFGLLPIVLPPYMPKLSFIDISIDGIAAPSIDSINYTITFSTNGTVNDLKLNYRLDSAALIEPLPDSIRDYSQPVIYSIFSKESEDTVKWKIIVNGHKNIITNITNEKPFIYYNQQNNTLVIKQTSNENFSYAIIYNSSGQVIKKAKLNLENNFINIPKVPSGLYVIKLLKNNAKYSKSTTINIFR
ncbi:MAG TPA: lamin tail domain-containing protein [Bacteroidales bacterium]